MCWTRTRPTSNRSTGPSNLDIRHSAAAMVVYEAPWKLRNLAGKLGNGWMVSGIGQFRSGLPYTMRTSGSLAEEFTTTRSGHRGAGTGDERLGRRQPGLRPGQRRPHLQHWPQHLPLSGHLEGGPALGRRFDLGHMRKLELLAESFNLFQPPECDRAGDHRHYLESGTPSGTLPSLNFLTGLKANTTAFGQPLNVNATNFYGSGRFSLG